MILVGGSFAPPRPPIPGFSPGCSVGLRDLIPGASMGHHFAWSWCRDTEVGSAQSVPDRLRSSSSSPQCAPARMGHQFAWSWCRDTEGGSAQSVPDRLRSFSSSPQCAPPADVGLGSAARALRSHSSFGWWCSAATRPWWNSRFPTMMKSPRPPAVYLPADYDVEMKGHRGCECRCDVHPYYGCL